MRIRNWFGRRDPEYADEIRAHIEFEAAENEARGMDPQAARAAAVRAFGNPGVVRETLREARPVYWLDTLAQDIRYGLRMLRRSPILAATVVVTLTFGIGLASTMFTIINAEAFRAKVDRDPAAFLRVIPAYTTPETRRIDPGAATLDDFRAFRAAAAPLADLAGWERLPASFDALDAPPFNALLVTCNFFSVWGLDRPLLGRLLREEECAAPGAAPVALISEELWRARFDADPAILGKPIDVNRQSLTVIGVLPARWVGRTYRDTELWIPYTMQPRFGSNTRLHGGGARDRFRESGTPWLDVAGRLRPGVSRSAVEAALAGVARQRDSERAGRRTIVHVTDGSVFGNPFERREAIWITTLALGLLTLVLVIVCANVTVLLLSRAAARRREMAVRLSLGAGWLRLARMLLTETLLLAGTAGAIAAWMCWKLPDPIRTYIVGERAPYSMAPDWRTFLYLGAITTFAGCLAGLAPALEFRAVDLAGAMKDGGRQRGSSRGRWRSVLIGAQVATSVLVLVLAWIMVRGHMSYRVDPGFETRRVLSQWLRLNRRYTAETAAAFYRAVEARLRSTPGVTAVAFAHHVKQTDLEPMRVPGRAPVLVTARAVSPGYFAALDIPVVQGRTLLPGETSAAVVSERLARQLWPGENPLGKTIENAARERFDIVGIARTLPVSYFNGNELQFYRPLTEAALNRDFLARFQTEPAPAIRAVTAIFRELDRDLFLIPETLDRQVQHAAHEFRVVAGVLLGIGAATMLLAVIGIYGVMAFAVRGRAPELGIRVALGAGRSHILSLVCISGMRPVWLGLAVGLLLAIGGAQVVGRAFSGTGVPMQVSDPVAFLGGALLIVLAAAAAMAGPALRATHTDPVTTLRHD